MATTAPAGRPAPFVVTVAATTAVQTFNGNGIDFPLTYIAANQLFGSWVPSTAQNSAQAAVDAQQVYYSRYYKTAASSLPAGVVGANTTGCGTTIYCADTGRGHAVVATVQYFK